ncbi:MAG: hypothetical protein HUJ22_12850 [Gracilimonas sp.]|uniref:hypothetical protein n=1 Tax=Gracilimonas sp. TaxID=1974203 RepID=UPI001998ED53|nr:hypothetical protein [Gracilimonas sp.]MBD3617450.1 hypothetical protein [Gracilimonas sp.]
MNTKGFGKLFLVIILFISVYGCTEYNYGYKSVNINPDKGFILSFPNSTYNVDSIVIDSQADSLVPERILETNDIFITKNGEKIIGGEIPFTGIISDYRGYTNDTLYVVDGIPTDGVLKIFFDEYLIARGHFKNKQRTGEWLIFSLEGDTVSSQTY